MVQNQMVNKAGNCYDYPIERNVITVELEKILEGKLVEHKKLGKGKVKEISDSYLIVKFDKSDKVSRFVYPDAFNKFLKLEDADTQTVVDKHLRMRNMIVADQERRKKQELQKLDDELKLHHKEDFIKKQKAAIAKIAREKRLKEKKKELV